MDPEIRCHFSVTRELAYMETAYDDGPYPLSVLEAGLWAAEPVMCRLAALTDRP